VTDYEAEIKHFLTYFNLSAEIFYDDLVATVNGFSGNCVAYYIYIYIYIYHCKNKLVVLTTECLP